MIIRFADVDTLLLALTSGVVPPEVARKPALAGFGDDKSVWVEPNVKLSSAVQSGLKRLGAAVGRSSDIKLDLTVDHWLQLLPLVRDETPLESLDRTTVLFDVSSGEELSRFALEILRQGNDRQSYRWLEETSKKNGARSRALLRVEGPPYYSLLKAIDGGETSALHAYLERAPGVWVELGYRHPLGANIKPPKGKLLLLRRPRQWQTVADAPFHDIYQIVEFQIPDLPMHWKDRPLPHRLTVTPRLRQAGSAEGAELWVLRGEGIDELNRFVQNAEDQLLHRLSFAVGNKDGRAVVVLRARQSKQAPPILVLPAEPYKSYLKLPNLYLPSGFILHPPLRRDVIRKLLADDAGKVTWLVRGENGRFAIESLPDDVFRPLTDWVDYVLDCDSEKLQAWIQANHFDFESFVCDDEQPSKPRKPPSGEKKRGSKSESEARAKARDEEEATAFASSLDSPLDDLGLRLPPSFQKYEPSELEKELHAVEQQFLSLPNGLEDERAPALWPRLAQLNASLKRTEDAVLCWLHALWDDTQTGQGTAAWFRTEIQAAAERTTKSKRLWLGDREPTGEDLDLLLSMPEPATGDVRALAAYLCWAARRSSPPQPLLSRLPAIQHYLEKYEQRLPARAFWLAWYHLVQLADEDVLALARARDRLLERLFQFGLRPEHDLPSFLRFAGRPAGQQFREVREWMKRLSEIARRWIEDNKDILDRKTPTQSYSDLLFAFGLARLGETQEAKHLLERAGRVLGGDDDVHRFLFQAYSWRIECALDGKPHTGPLPQALMDSLENMEMLSRYVVERLRHNSRVLEPDRQVDPYRHWAGRGNKLERALIELFDLTDRVEIQMRLRALLGKEPPGSASNEDYAKIVRAGLELAPHLGEEFAREMLERTLPAFNGLPEPSDAAHLAERAKFLEKALFTAAHFGDTEFVRPLVARFREMLQARGGVQAIDSVSALAEQSFRSLRKVGMRDQIHALLNEMADLVLQGRDIDALLRSFRSKSDAVGSLIALLHVAGAWYYFGREDMAEAVVLAARAILLGDELTQSKQRRDLACVYARTVGLASPALALPRLEEMFHKLKGYRDTFTTSNYFSVVQMDLIEATVLAAVHDDFTQGAEARRWLDEDEYLVRQRIHNDVRQALAQA
jgi:hypothetical protein